ncbi:MAG: c-type cytochrome [Flavobacteriaceae bacterium]
MDELRILKKRLFWLFLALFALVAAVLIELFDYKPSTAPKVVDLPKAPIESWKPKNVLLALEDKDPLVKQGYLLIKESPTQMGPSAENPDMRFTGNHMACANCHLQSGTQAGAASWVGVVERFPQFGGRSNKIGTIQDRINGCMERSMNGKKLPIDSEAMKAIVAYMNWLGTDVPENRKKEFSGFVEIEIPEVAVDLVKGKAVYEKECVLCHRNDGQGVLFADASKGYQYPPLWGKDSYNNGAGMHRVLTSAQFIKSNMPYLQATWDKPKLTDEEAFNVAGYINSFDRPVKANTENDYPDKKLKPVSTPYGPWADGFSAEQHKNGPFQPIIAYYKQEYNITKTK